MKRQLHWYTVFLPFLSFFVLGLLPVWGLGEGGSSYKCAGAVYLSPGTKPRPPIYRTCTPALGDNLPNSLPFSPVSGSWDLTLRLWYLHTLGLGMVLGDLKWQCCWDYHLYAGTVRGIELRPYACKAATFWPGLNLYVTLFIVWAMPSGRLGGTASAGDWTQLATSLTLPFLNVRQWF